MADEDQELPSGEENPWEQFGRVEEPKQPEEHAKQTEGPADWEQFGRANDERAPFGESTQPKSSSLGVAAREFARGVVPNVAGAVAGVGTGLLTSEASPLVAIPAGLGAAAVVGGATRKLQDEITDTLGLDSPESRASDVAEHPYAAMGGGLAPAALTFQPASIGSSIAQRGGAAAIMGGVDIGQQAIEKGISNIDPTEVAANAAVGGALGRPRNYVENAATRGAMAIGGRPASRYSGVSTGDFAPDVAAAADEISKNDNQGGTSTAEPPPAGRAGAAEPSPAAPPAAEQAMQTSQQRAPTPVKDLPFAEDAEPLEGGHEEITPPAPKNTPNQEPPPENFGGREAGGQNENVLPAATPAEDAAIAGMKPKPPPEGEPHSLGAAAGAGQSELPEATPPVFAQNKYTPPEETANRFQEYARVEKLKRAGEVNDILDKLQDATGRGPWNAVKAMFGRSEGNMRDLHEAVENNDFSKLTPKQQEIWDKSGLSDLLDESRDWFQKEIDAGRMVDHGQLEGAPRLTEKEWARQTGESNTADPVTGDVRKRNLTTNFEHEPPIYQMRDGKGNTQIVSDTPNGFKIWDKGNAQDITHPDELSIGAKIDHDGKTWTVERAPTDAIEKNVKDRDGDFIKYVKSPAVNIFDTIMKQRDITRNTKALDLIRTDPAFDGMRATTDPKNGWVQTTIPQLKGMYFDPEVASQLNSFHIPGMEVDLGAAGRAVAGINRFLTGSLFWNPVPHTLNTAAHWFVGRGADWFMPNRYPEFFRSSRDALSEVLGNGPAYRDYLKEGAPFMWPSIRAGEAANTIGKLGEVAIQQNPKAWDAIARTMGLNAGRDLVKLWYQGARQVLWQGGDVLAMQRVMELKSRGMSMNDAIQETRHHLPDYNIPYKVMGQTWLSKLMQDPRNIFSVFNRYHMGVFKSLAKIVNDSVAPGVSHDDRMKAIGNALALTTLAYVVAPALNAGWQKITGNPDAEANPRGPLSHAKKAIMGEESYTGAVGSAFTMSPFFRSAIDVLGNKDWRGKTIIEPKSPFHQQLAQGLGHYGLDQLGPVKTFGDTLRPGSPKGGFLHEMGSQLGDFKNPTEKQKANKEIGQKLDTKAAKARAKKPANILEYGAKKVFGYAEGGEVEDPLTVKPSKEGQWSDEDEARRIATDNSLVDTITSRGMNMSVPKMNRGIANAAKSVWDHFGVSSAKAEGN